MRHEGKTMQIELSRDDAEMLRDLLKQRVLELDKEISRTESLDFKRDLQRTDRAMERLLGKIVMALEQAPESIQ